MYVVYVLCIYIQLVHIYLVWFLALFLLLVSFFFFCSVLLFRCCASLFAPMMRWCSYSCCPRWVADCLFWLFLMKTTTITEYMRRLKHLYKSHRVHRIVTESWMLLRGWWWWCGEDDDAAAAGWLNYKKIKMFYFRIGLELICDVLVFVWWQKCNPWKEEGKYLLFLFACSFHRFSFEWVK